MSCIVTETMHPLLPLHWWGVGSSCIVRAFPASGPVESNGTLMVLTGKELGFPADLSWIMLLPGLHHKNIGTNLKLGIAWDLGGERNYDKR